MHGWSHLLWAALGAIFVFPLKKLWDWMVERWWESFKATFMTGFKNTQGGQEFLKAFYANRAKKDMQYVKEHPELEKVLHCKECQGKGCDNCGGTGWA